MQDSELLQQLIKDGNDMLARTDQFFLRKAKEEGLTYNQFCRKYGIIGPSQERQIRRREVPLDA